MLVSTDKQLLDRRAQSLAQPRQEVGRRQDWRSVLAFRLFGEPYGVDLDRVEAIARIGEIYPVPLTPPHLQGIIRRHGHSITLVSLRHFFNPAAQGVYDADYALIVQAAGKRFAVQAEDVEGVGRADPEEVRSPADNMDPALRPYVDGVTLDGVILLSLEKLVAARHFAVGHPRKQPPLTSAGEPPTQERR